MSRLIDLMQGNPDTIHLSIPQVLRGGVDLYNGFPVENVNEPDHMCQRGGLMWVCGIPTALVLWQHGYVSIQPRNAYMDAISFQFSGCIMAAYEYLGNSYVAHIQRGEYDRLNAWLNFVRKNRRDISRLVMFRPDAEEWDRVYSLYDTREKDVYLWGVITPRYECYSVCVRDLVNYEDGKRFSLIFLTHHYAGLGVEAYEPLLETQDDNAHRAFFNSMQKWQDVPPRSL